MNISDYKEDLQKREAGSPCYIEEASIDVRRIGGTDYNKEIEEIKKREYGFDHKDVDNNKVFGIWLAEHGVTGWSGLFDGEDEIPFSKKNARKLFTDPAYYMSINAILMVHGTDYNNYLYDEAVEDAEQVKKN